MNYGTPAISTPYRGFRWGIRWVTAMHSVHDYDEPPCLGKASNITTDTWEEALERYRGSGPAPVYAAEVLALYNEGKNPQPGAPTCIWPIKADGRPRQ